MNRTRAVDVSSHAVLPSLSDGAPWARASDESMKRPSPEIKGARNAPLRRMFNMSSPLRASL